MLDIIGAIVLTANFLFTIAVLISWIPRNVVRPSWLVTTGVIWFATMATLAALGTFAAPTIGTPAVGIAVLAPVALLLAAATRSSTVQRLGLGIPLAVLVAMHAARLLGVFFLLLLADDRLPSTFALAAGWGDIAVGLAAVPIAWAVHRQIAGWRALTLAWNVAGFVDLITAVTLGVGSAPGSPLRFIFESSTASAVASLPWVLIPGVFVPMYLLSHIAVFAQLRRAFADSRRQGHQDLVWEGTAR